MWLIEWQVFEHGNNNKTNLEVLQSQSDLLQNT